MTELCTVVLRARRTLQHDVGDVSRSAPMWYKPRPY